MISAAAEEKTERGTAIEAGVVLDGKYRVDHLVGQGGMAAVWAGTNERTGKRVALKVLLPALTATPGADSLFQREGLAASRVNHPNVVTVFDVIEHHGMACIVMELLTGEPLDRYRARLGGLSVNDVYGLLLPAMRGVSAAHAQGVIHRDLKPQNIFVCIGPDGRAVTTKVLDFGISIIVERARDPAVGQTVSVPMGTPAYMAPEQILGSTPIDERADVYGFGVLFYEALTGQVPFPGEPGGELYERILNEPAPPLAKIRPDLTPGLVQIIETALAKDPAQRHANLDCMLSALEDEFLPATPFPRALTPSLGGIPVIVPEAPTGRRGTPVEATLRREPSGEHQATQFLVNFPLEAETGRRRTGSGGFDREDLLRRVDSSHETAPVTMTKIRWFRQPHRWQAVASVGFAGLVAGVALIFWALSGNDTRAPAGLPPLVVPSRPPASMPSEPPSDPVVAPSPPAPLAESEAPSVPLPAFRTGATTTSSGTTVQARAPHRAVLSGSRLAARDGGKSASVRRLVARSGLSSAPSAPPPPVRPGPAVATTRPRAGSLSAEDF